MGIHSSTVAWENPMDRGAWRATVRGVARVVPDLVTKPPKTSIFNFGRWFLQLQSFFFFIILVIIVLLNFHMLLKNQTVNI